VLIQKICEAALRCAKVAIYVVIVALLFDREKTGLIFKGVGTPVTVHIRSLGDRERLSRS
jgi:hypothetical protein